MKRSRSESVDTVLGMFLRDSGLETPLLQYRLVQQGAEVVGESVAVRTHARFVRDQTLWVRVDTPALRTQLSMMRQQIVRKLNERVGSTVIYDLKFC